METTVTFDDSGDAHVETYDGASMVMGDET